VQQEKLRLYGTESSESKDDFKQRIYEEYNKLNQIKKPGQEIILSYDFQENKCKLDIKD
jgi:hypothetical protein